MSEQVTKVVYNACYGGFGLSPLAIKRYAELRGRPCYFFTNERSATGKITNKYVPISIDELGRSILWYAFDIPDPNSLLEVRKEWAEMTEEERKNSNEEFGRHHICARDIKRTDPILVQVVEELGDKANGFCAKLRIEAIPVGCQYRIDEYDGSESVMTRDSYEWETA